MQAQAQTFGDVVEAIDHKRFKVQFDESVTLEGYSNNL